MPTNLTGSQINATYSQLLHVDGGPAATEKAVLSGTGVVTALKVGTASASVGNIRVSGNTISAITGDVGISSVAITSGSITGITDLAVADGGTGASTAADARTNLGLGTIATQAASSVAITGGSITGITDLAVADGGTGASTASDARTNLGLGSMATQAASSVAITGGSITGITDLAVADGGTGASTLTGYVKGNGTSAFTASASVPFADLSGRAYGSFSDITDQTGSTTAATAVKFGTNEITGAGISITNNGSSDPTRITFDAAGTYMVAPNLQFVNSDNNDHDVTIWLMLNGANVARSATKITVPKSTDGGNAFFQIIFYITVTASQYVEIMWLPENTAVTIDHTAAASGPPSIPAIPSAIVSAERIG